jgi:branched-chain amino acid aminotransferase
MPLQETEKIWMDGKFVDWKEAKVHVLTHGLHYGSTVFEGIRCYTTLKGPAVFRLKEHVKRLFDSAKIYFMDMPYSQEQISKAILETIKVNKLKAGYIRPIVYRGCKEMGLNPKGCPVKVAIAVWPWGTYLGEEGVKNGIRAVVSSWRRIPSECLPMKAKAGGQYIGSQLAKLEALAAGYDEAIMLDTRGYAVEGSAENLFIVKDGVIITPSLGSCALPGITRSSVIELAKNEFKYEVWERDIERDELFTADEIFFTGTAAEVVPVRSIDSRDVGEGKPGPVTVSLQKKFFDVIKGKVPKYTKWLTLVK